MKKNAVKSIVGKNGKLAIRFFDNEGKIKQKSLGIDDTKANRKMFYRDIALEFERALKEKAVALSKVPVNFGFYVDKHIESLEANRHTKAVAHTGRANRIKMYFGADTDINTITELCMDEFFQSLKCKRVTKLDWLVVLRAIMLKAKKGNALVKDITEHLKLSHETNTYDESAVQPFSVEEIKRLLSHSKGSSMHNYLGIAFHLGTRPEETIALRIKDIDFNKAIVQIEQSITKGQNKATKTSGSKRLVPLPNQAKVFLRAQIVEAEKKGSLYLFSHADASTLNDIEDLRGRKHSNGPWYKLLDEAKVPYRKLMQTRHTFAVQAIKSNKYTLQEIASIMGHTSLAMIISHYAKYLGNSHLNVARTVDIFEGLGDLMGDFENNNLIEKVA